MTDIWAVIPVKETIHAKQRLAGLVPAPLRAGLALAMFEDVIAALAQVPELAGIAVITTDTAITDIALRHGARVISAEAQGGHTTVVMAAARRLAAEGRGGMLQLPGDVPLVSPGEISTRPRSER